MDSVNTVLLDETQPVVRSSQAIDQIDVNTLRHPAESTRSVLLKLVAAVTLGGFSLWIYTTKGIAGLITAFFTVALVHAMVWLSIQIARWRLLGNGALVTADSFPQLHEAIKEICDRIGYRGNVPVFVTPKADGAVSVTSYLGSRIVLIEGDLVKELTTDELQGRIQLNFLLATAYGSLKASYDRWGPVIHTLSMLRIIVFVIPFLAAWMRVITYTGDRIAFRTCGDLRESLIALNRILVGGASSRDLNIEGVLNQAVAVHSNAALRLMQMLSSQPHLTNRYLELLAFGRQETPDQFESVMQELDLETRRKVIAELDNTKLKTSYQSSWTDRRFSILTVVTAVYALLSAIGLPIGPLIIEKIDPGAPTARSSFDALFHIGNGLSNTTLGFALVIPAVIVISVFAIAFNNRERQIVTTIAGCTLLFIWIESIAPYIAVMHSFQLLASGFDLPITAGLLLSAAWCCRSSALSSASNPKYNSSPSSIADSANANSRYKAFVIAAYIWAAGAFLFSAFSNDMFFGVYRDFTIAPAARVTGLMIPTLLVGSVLLMKPIENRYQTALINGWTLMLLCLSFWYWRGLFAFSPAAILLIVAGMQKNSQVLLDLQGLTRKKTVG